jgi:hypothetical protein
MKKHKTMKTYKILNSDNGVLTFTEDDLTYCLYLEYSDDEPLKIFEAEDTGHGLLFNEKFGKELDYSTIDYLRLFLNLIEREDKSLFESYIVTEPVGIL